VVDRSIYWCDARTFTCPNPACGKVFAATLKTLNLQQDSAQTYAACPFCLTKITEITEAQMETVNKPENKPEKTQVETTLPKEKPNKSKEKPSCQYHMGYLSEREKNQQIPDECIICQDIVECMLRKMRT